MSVGSMGILAESLRILRPFWLLVLFSTVIGGVSGLATAAVLATINKMLHTEGDAIFGLLLAFGGFCVVSVVCEVIGNIGNTVVGQQIIAELRKDLSGKILSAPIAEIERYKSHRLIAALAQDVNTIGVFTFNFSTIAIAFAITISCFIYLALLSSSMVAVALVAVGIIAIGQVVASKVGSRGFVAVRNAHDDLQKHYHALIDGAKEIRINKQRRSKISDQLNGTIDRIRDLFIQAMRVFFAAKAFNSTIYFLTLFVVLALGTRFAVDQTAVSGFVLVLLYVKGPIEQLVLALPLLSEARVSFRKVSELSAAFARGELPTPHWPEIHFAGTSIQLRNARYEFPPPLDGESFVLGPINLTINRGEVIFIIGKNGCGKTTLIKLLLGLYTPAEGELLCDGKSIRTNELNDYRELFSAIFFDYYLFEDLVMPNGSVAKDVSRYLHLLEIAHKVSIRDGIFSTTDLSTGQRKRLALIQVFLEQRPIVVLDEWAADQDPSFRRVFYEKLLPDMKRQGKTVIIISHDDRYFKVADRLIKMDGGKIVEDTQSAGAAIGSIAS